MTQENFVYWLNGFLEISDAKKLNEKQVQIIKDHLALVFDKQTPNRNILTDIKMPTSSTVDISKIPNTFTKPDPNPWGQPNTGGAICSGETPKNKRGFGGNEVRVYC